MCKMVTMQAMQAMQYNDEIASSLRPSSPRVLPIFKRKEEPRKHWAKLCLQVTDD